PVGPRRGLILILQIRKRKTMGVREALHVGERIFRIGFRIVRADRRKSDSLAEQRARIRNHPVNHGLHVWAVIAEEDDHRAVLAGDIGERIGAPVGRRQPELRCGRAQRGGRRRCGHRHIGGVMPSRPTRHARPCSVPSGCLTATIKTFAPGLRSFLSPTSYMTMGVSAGTKIFFFSSFYFFVSVWPSTAVTYRPTIFIVILLFRPQIP